MAPNLPPSITVNRNLASTIKNYIKANGGKNVSEAELNAILQKVAKFDAERDAGTREGGSIFSGGSTYLGGTGKDFVVQNGQQIQFSAEEFNEIFKGYLNPIETKTPEASAQNPIQPQPLEAKPTPLVPDEIQNSENAPEMPQKPQGLDAETTVQNLDGKFLEREVNGQKQKIAVVDVNGEKVRRVVNEDGTLGDTLVPISTMGKNKYITQTEMDNKMRATLGLADNEEIPKDIKGEFVSIGGTPTLIFKKDGKLMDQSQLNEYITQIQEQRVEKFDSQMSTEGKAEINDSGLLASAQFNVINNKYGDKQGNVNFEEYFNYEKSTIDPQLLAENGITEDTIRGASSMNFNAIDADMDGEITQQELKDFYDNANSIKDNYITTDEIVQYGSEAIMKRMQPNIENVVSQGYQVQDFEGSPVFVKDGKSFWMNMDGTLGNQIGMDENGLIKAHDAIEPPVTDQEPVLYSEQSAKAPVQAETPVTPQAEMRDVGPVEYKNEDNNVDQQVQNPKPNVEMVEVSRQGVSGSYSLTAGKDGEGFNLVTDMKVSGNGEASKFFRLNGEQGNGLYFNENTKRYSFRGIEHHRLSFLESRMDFISQKVSVNNAIYNDLLNKQKAGTELTDAEKSFIDAHLKNIEQYGLGIDSNGNLINIMNE